MLQVKKAINIGLFFGAFAYITVAHQVAAITVTTPISADDPLIKPAVDNVLAGIDDAAGNTVDVVDNMRNNVRTATMQSQSTIDMSQKAVDHFTQLPMQQYVMPMMQNVLMIPIMKSLASEGNSKGLVNVFAPAEFQPPVTP